MSKALKSYPIFIHHRAAHEAIGFEFPDFAGCFGAADSWGGVTQMAQEALECHLAGEAFELPKPSDPSRLTANPRFTNGVWMMVEIDTAKLDDTPTRVNISLPRSVLSQIDEHTRKTHETRSGFLAKAAMKELG